MTDTRAPWGTYLGWKVLPKDVVSDRIADDHNWTPVYLAADVDPVLEEVEKVVKLWREQASPIEGVTFRQAIGRLETMLLATRLRARARTQDE